MLFILNKMKKVKVLSLQNWFDISIQYTGNVYNSFAIAAANNSSVTDVLTTGEIVIIPSGLLLSSKTIQYFEARSLKPATGHLKRTDAKLENYLLPNIFPILL